MKIPCDDIQEICGIYLIRNLVNNKIYVGQAVNVRRRWLEHLRAGQPEIYSNAHERDLRTAIHLAIQKYGIENFSISILEKCERNELNEKEIYWIKTLKSNDKKIGYNLTSGGETSGIKGEQHGMSKLTQEQVDQIYELLKHSNLNLDEINQLYPNVCKSTISQINHGKRWRKENETYPLKILPSVRGERSRSKFTEEQVMDMRTLYSQGVPRKEIVAKYSNIAGENTIAAIIYGKSFKFLPYYNKAKNEWIQPCIDYPQSLNAGEQGRQ